jgi:6-pyruvoyltetrahydropterin/6-carboxytetrahydropterin synthase
VFVSKADFKFNAAHFIAYKGYRERLHGHNYRVSVRLQGHLGPDGYVVDFGDIKRATRRICKGLNELFICPCRSDALQICKRKNPNGGENVEIVCEDGSRFSFPLQDCAMLPIIHSSAEEIATYLCGKIVEEMSVEMLRARGVTSIEVGVAEAKNQLALYTYDFELDERRCTTPPGARPECAHCAPKRPRPCPALPSSETSDASTDEEDGA